MDDHSDAGREAEAQPMPAEVRFLKWLVTGLALVMGGGMIALVALMWVRLGAAPLPDLPAAIDLPAGASAEAITFARDWIVVVTETGEVLLYDREGNLRDRVQP